MRKLTCKNGNIVYVGTQEEVRTIHHAMYRAWLKDKIQITPTGYFTYERIRIEGFNLIQGILLDKREGYFDPIDIKPDHDDPTKKRSVFVFKYDYRINDFI